MFAKAVLANVAKADEKPQVVMFGGMIMSDFNLEHPQITRAIRTGETWEQIERHYNCNSCAYQYQFDHEDERNKEI